MSVAPVLAVVPARGGSKGLPGKNVRPLAGLPLLAHSLACARMTPEIDELVVSTDDQGIADMAKSFGARVPFLRPAELATDTAPMLPVLQHALRSVEDQDGRRFGSLLLLDPTSPGRTPEDIATACASLREQPEADGIVGVSVPEFDPLWHCVLEGEDGYLEDLSPEARRWTRRQDVPRVYRINACLYLWRRDFILETDDWRNGKLLLHEIPEARAVHIDTLEEFERTEYLLKGGYLSFPWLDEPHG